jgi:hypothetical protein
MLALGWVMPTMVTAAAWGWTRFVPSGDYAHLGYGGIVHTSRFVTALGLTVAAWGIYAGLHAF